MRTAWPRTPCLFVCLLVCFVCLIVCRGPLRQLRHSAHLGAWQEGAQTPHPGHGLQERHRTRLRQVREQRGREGLNRQTKLLFGTGLIE